MNYRFVKITSFYREYLDYYYDKYPEIKNKSYQEQFQHLMEQDFAWSNYYQKNLNKLGVEFYEIICNARYLQEAWANENGFKQNGKQLIIEQLKKIKPDVLFFQDTSLFHGEWVKQLKEKIHSIKKIIGFRCSPYSNELAELFNCFDFMIVCSNQFVDELKRFGYKTYEINHAFENSIISKITNNNSQPVTDFIFIGSILSGIGFHSQRKKFIETIINKNIDLTLFGNVPEIGSFDLKSRQAAFLMVRLMKKLGMKSLINSLPLLNKAINLNSMPQKNIISKKLQEKVHPPIYGIDMLQLLNKAKITFNIHADVSGNAAANIRIFEATGCGSWLLTDRKHNLNKFFEEDKEIVTYKTEDECIEKALWLIEHNNEREQIAQSGQKRTLSEHNYYNRAIQLNEIINKELKKY